MFNPLFLASLPYTRAARIWHERTRTPSEVAYEFNSQYISAPTGWAHRQPGICKLMLLGIQPICYFGRCLLMPGPNPAWGLTRETRFITLSVMSAAPQSCTHFVRRPPFPLCHKSLLFLWGFVGEQFSPMVSKVNKLPAACLKSIVFNRLLPASSLSPTWLLKFDVRWSRFITLSVSRTTSLYVFCSSSSFPTPS